MRQIFSCERSDAHQALDQADTEANEADDHKEHQQLRVLNHGQVLANPLNSAGDHFGQDVNDTRNSSNFGLRNKPTFRNKIKMKEYILTL